VKNPAITIENETWRNVAINAVKRAPLGFEVEIRPPLITKGQNKLIHGCFEDVARARVPFAGRDDWDRNDWKQFLISGFGKVKNDHSVGRLMEGIEGETMVLRDEVSRMPKETAAEFLTYIIQWGDRKGVRWRYLPSVDEPAR